LEKETLNWIPYIGKGNPKLDSDYTKKKETPIENVEENERKKMRCI